MHCEVGGGVKKMRLNGPEPVTWTHSRICCHGCERGPSEAVDRQRRARDPSTTGPVGIMVALVN